MLTKICGHCKEEKSTNHFYKHPTAKYGVGSICASCLRTEGNRVASARDSTGWYPSKEGEKLCRTCGEIRPLSHFSKDKHSPSGLHTRCRTCCTIKAQERRLKHKVDTARVLPDTVYCSSCKSVLPCEQFSVDRGSKSGRQSVCRDCGIKKREAVRIEGLTHYSQGIPHCACCGETTVEFLSFDHINGGGRKHAEERRKLGEPGPLSTWLKKNNFPEGYQVLCHNCNQARGYYGVCPHQRNKI